MSQLQRSLLVWMVTGLSVLLVLRDIGEVSLSKFIFLAYITLFMVLANYRTIVYMACFIFPLVCGLPGTYILLGTLLLLVIKRGSIDKQQVFAILFVAALELVASIWYPEWELVEIVGYVVFAGVMLFLILDSRILNYRLCVHMYLFGVLLLCLIIVISTLKNAPSDWLSRFAKGWFRFGTDIADREGVKITLNANSLAYYSITGTICGIFLTETGQGREKIWYTLIALVVGLSGLLTLSRSWMLMMVICLLFYVRAKVSSKQFWNVLITLAILGIIAILVLQQNSDLLKGLLTRLQGDDIRDGNGRIDIFIEYMQSFFGNIRYVLFGMGTLYTMEISGASNSLHNGLQQILICCGLPGFIVYMTIMIKPAWGAFLRIPKGKRIIYSLPIISVVLFVQTIQFLNPAMLMLPYIIGIYALKSGGQNCEANNCNS